MIFEYVLLNEEIDQVNHNKLEIVDGDSIVISMLNVPCSYRDFFDKIDKQGSLRIHKDDHKPKVLNGFIKMISTNSILVRGVETSINYTLCSTIIEETNYFVLNFIEVDFFQRLNRIYKTFRDYYPVVSQIEFSNRYAASLYKYILENNFPRSISFDLFALRAMLTLHKDSSYITFRIIELKVVPMMQKELEKIGIIFDVKRQPENYAKNMIFSMNYTDYNKRFS